MHVLLPESLERGIMERIAFTQEELNLCCDMRLMGQQLHLHSSFQAKHAIVNSASHAGTAVVRRRMEASVRRVTVAGLLDAPE